MVPYRAAEGVRGSGPRERLMGLAYPPAPSPSEGGAGGVWCLTILQLASSVLYRRMALEPGL